MERLFDGCLMPLVFLLVLFVSLGVVFTVMYLVAKWTGL